MERFRTLVIVAAALGPAPAVAQRINIDYCNAFGVPPAAYPGAAAQPGIWNNPLGPAAFALVNIAGGASGASISGTSGVCFSTDNAGTAGGDQQLYDDLLDLGPSPAARTFTIGPMVGGSYRVFTYAWAPDNAGFVTTVSVVGSPTAAQSVGGAWPGGHVNPTTFARHGVAVAAGGNIIVNTTAATGFGSVNGFQIRQVPTFIFASNRLPPSSNYAGQFHARYQPSANLVVTLIDPVHTQFSSSFPPPPPQPGATTTHTFGSLVIASVAFDHNPPTPIKAPATTTVRVSFSAVVANNVQVFDTELLQMDISGGNLPAGVRVRESPTRASSGLTTIQSVPGGALISSYFDVFTELSLDGGATWTPSVDLFGNPFAGYMELGPSKDPPLDFPVVYSVDGGPATAVANPAEGLFQPDPFHPPPNDVFALGPASPPAYMTQGELFQSSGAVLGSAPDITNVDRISASLGLGPAPVVGGPPFMGPFFPNPGAPPAFPAPPGAPIGTIGIGPGDNVDALSFGRDGGNVLLFSVGPSAIGVPGTAVNFHAVVSPFAACLSAALPSNGGGDPGNEAAGDIFISPVFGVFGDGAALALLPPAPAGSNTLAYDELSLGLQAPAVACSAGFGPAEDDLDALEASDALTVDGSLTGVPDGVPDVMPYTPVYVSLAFGSPSIGGPDPCPPFCAIGPGCLPPPDPDGVTPDDILVSPVPPAGPTFAYAIYARGVLDIGLLPGDDLDALALFDSAAIGILDCGTDVALFSLATGSPSLASGANPSMPFPCGAGAGPCSPGDVFSTSFAGPGVATIGLYAAAPALGLLFGDELDALDIGWARTKIVSSNPPTANSFNTLPIFRDVLQNTTVALTAQGIGQVGTPNEGAITYDQIACTFDLPLCVQPTPGNIHVGCTDAVGNGDGDCPSVTAVAATGVNQYTLRLSASIPVRECTTITFQGTKKGEHLQYQYLPGDVNLNGVTSGQDVLSLVTAINTATTVLVRHDTNRNGLTSGQDVLRMVQLINGGVTVFPPAGYNGAVVAACP